jgi:hypothetical protein
LNNLDMQQSLQTCANYSARIWALEGRTLYPSLAIREITFQP